MATELYGMEARIVDSIGSIGVSTNTNLYFIGTAPSGDLNKPITITSMGEANTQLGLAPGDGHNLTDACIAAFQIAGLSQITCIVISHSADASASDYLGDATLGTGINAYEQALRDAPTATNLVCIPRMVDGSVLAGMIALCKNADGLKSYMIIDNDMANDHVNASGYPVSSEIVTDKAYSDAYSSVVWGYIKTSANYIVSGAAVRACLMAKADSNKGVPYRVGGNLVVSGVSTIVCKHVEAGENDDPDVITWPAVKMTKAIANSLSADGICSFRNRASTIVTWGDHTSAFSGGTISDELGRFENRARMNFMIANRWCIKYDPIIDDPIDLSMREMIINEQKDYLNGLVGIGALIGEQSVEFVASENPIDNIVQGQFVWNIATTATNPFKYGLAKVAFSSRGLSVYTV